MPRSTAVVDGGRLAYVRAGVGAPVIVFLSGAGMDIDSWFKIWPAAAEMRMAFAYDRPGVGRSDRPTTPQTGEVVVATLRELLRQAGGPPPYVLVGHSLGGLHAELFARSHPDEVCGVVLVESAGPEEAEGAPSRGTAARVIAMVFATIDRLRGRRGLSEMDAVGETIRQIAAAPPFPDVPLIVVTGGRRMRTVPDAAFEAHQEAQRRRVMLSPQGRQVIAEASGHFPQLHQPEVVIGAIRDVLARSST